jgi:hypothetical protein
LVLLVNDSEYSKSTGAKPILSRGCIYVVSPGALLLLLRQLRVFAAAAARAPTPPRPPFGGEGSTKKIKSPVASGMAFGNVCVGVGVVEVVLMSRCTAKRWVCTLETKDF